ncbi:MULTISPECIES: M15 family metallopeptidase [unclassified Okeania]|uniref:M15 family metallopeptidase n=1 Tax=unclassified Okeania TaxID=2634635 RepID=UPI0013B83D8D|nr:MULTISPECIES: M15 family metallopeptidase [unclassified Okeania]NES76174.1 M15 family metallopeptidase [Okeania sp. SIO1H4]NET14253.1 M15 family metallopeptidase [Okeania sp. SIO1H6]NET19377.1 M15 family metallopeptidase [Okeania sp. SIO1H5]NET93260.1 M15 family metallopeptidase [Okeania sp. SIO1H2]
MSDSDYIIDSNFSRVEALFGLPTNCPPEIAQRQRLIDVFYWGFDNKKHKGQILIDQTLVNDIIELFEFFLDEDFPICSAIVLGASQFRCKNGGWSDNLSMEANNTSAFNFREVGGNMNGGLSLHALGLALDINPSTNAAYGYGNAGNLEVYPRSKRVYPSDLPRDSDPGALWKNCPVVNFLQQKGWIWGGDWTLEDKGVVDMHHFEKVPEGYPAKWIDLLAPLIKKNWDH